MQVSAPVQGVSTIPRRRRLNALVAIVAIVVIAAVVALMVWVMPLATSGVGTGDAIRDDGLYYPLPHGKVAPDA